TIVKNFPYMINFPLCHCISIKRLSSSLVNKRHKFSYSLHTALYVFSAFRLSVSYPTSPQKSSKLPTSYFCKHTKTSYNVGSFVPSAILCPNLNVYCLPSLSKVTLK